MIFDRAKSKGVPALHFCAEQTGAGPPACAQNYNLAACQIFPFWEKWNAPTTLMRNSFHLFRAADKTRLTRHDLSLLTVEPDVHDLT